MKAQKAKVFKIVRGGPLGFFENPVCCKSSKKVRGDFKNFEKKTKNENFRTVS